MKGSEAMAKQAAESGDFERLQKMEEHGADILSFKDTGNSDNSLLHYAAKTSNM